MFLLKVFVYGGISCIHEELKIDKEYWSLLYLVLNRWQPVKRGPYILIPKATYNELMNIFEEIDSRETRIMLIGKLIWLKYEQRSWGLDY